MRLLRAAGALAMLALPTPFPAHLPEGVPREPAEPVTVVRGTVRRHSTLATLLEGELAPARVHALVEAARPAYDLALLTAGRPFGLAVDSRGLLRFFSYGIDELRTLRVLPVGDGLRADILTRRYDSRVECVAGRIRSSLFAAVAEAGEQDQLALDLAEIFAWDVDFNTELRAGDGFRACVLKLSLDGRHARYGSIQAAELLRGERVLRAVRYQGRRAAGYYNPDGTPLRKAFLRSPLRFTRISSRYSAARRHPILHRLAAHRGVDYAAPRGTPVHAAADGVVRLAGRHAGFGLAVRLRHANGFETLYGHLSRVAVRPGQRVEQGAPLGSVGATGLATGPHLHYAMLRAGSPIDPLRVELPPAEPVPADERAAFELASESALGLLERAERRHAKVEARTAAPGR